MSDDEEMTDLSQIVTQSGTITQSGSITFTSLSLSNKEPPEPWGKIVIYRIVQRRLGMRVVANYSKHFERSFGKFTQFLYD